MGSSNTFIEQLEQAWIQEFSSVFITPGGILVSDFFLKVALNKVEEWINKFRM